MAKKKSSETPATTAAKEAVLRKNVSPKLATTKKTTKKKAAKKTQQPVVDAATPNTPSAIKTRITLRPSAAQSHARQAESLRMLPSYQQAAATEAYYEIRQRMLTQIRDSTSPIIGIDCGPKIVQNEVTNMPCVRVFVEEKKPRCDLTAAERIPDHHCGVPTDVVAINAIRMASPIQGSDEIDPHAPTGAVGRMGVMVLGIADTVAASGSIMLLTATHVVQGNRAASVLDNAVQVFDTTNNVIGKSIPNVIQNGTVTELNWRRDEFLDAALIDPSSNDALPGIRGHAGVPMNFLRKENLVLNQRVLFLLPGQQPRLGIVESWDNFFTATRGNTTEDMSDNILVRSLANPFAIQGDSGGLVVTDESPRAAVGIVRAVFDIRPTSDGTPVSVSSNPEFTLLTPMYRIVGAMHVYPTDHLNP